MMSVDATRLSRTALLISDKTILKTEPPARSVWRRIIRCFLGGSLPFQNEILHYQANPDLFPNIQTIPEAKLILIAYRAPIGPTTPEDLTEDMIRALWDDIGAMRGHCSFGPVKHTAFRLINGPVPRALRDLFKSRAISPRRKPHLAFRLLALQVRQTRIGGTGRVVHNDLMLHNILKYDREFLPIDFEDVLVERKWIYADITDLIFQSENWTYDSALNQLRKISGKEKPPASDAVLKAHLKFGFLRYHIRATIMARLTAEQRSRAAAQLDRDFS